MLLAQQRRQKILDLLREEGSVRVSQLAQMFNVSEPTIRQDLKQLEKDGAITREHGGAFLKDIPHQVRTLSLQHTENMDKKAAIGKRAAELIDNGDSIILDSGTTVTEIAKHLYEKHDLKIVTDSLNIALLVGVRYDFDVMVTGGEFKAPTLSLTGEKASVFFDDIHVSKLFLATGGFSVTSGLTYPGLSDIPVKKAMIASADKVILAADSTKIGVTSFASLGGIELIDVLVTDTGISDEIRARLESKDIEVIVAE
jgi:DeoR/GlpR family transcriptional regulator of sugar metabolism